MPLRVTLTIFGLLSGLTALLAVLSGAQRGTGHELIGAIILGLPVLLAAAVWRRRVEADSERLRSFSLFSQIEIMWGDVRRIDRGRRSFTIETAKGPVSAGWLAEPDRERLMKLVIERAKLVSSSEEPRWGLVAQYVPRRQDIQFVPHHRRKPKEEPKDGPPG